MFDFLKPVVGVSSSDWIVIKRAVLDAAEAVGQRFRDNEAELERLANEVRRQEAAIELLKAQANHRQSFAQKLREKGKP